MNATETKTYRGRTLEEVLPKIKAELGPDAEIVRQRSGLTGGVGGFFQRQCVEVEARAPEVSSGQGTVDSGQARRFDAYDEDPTAAPTPSSFVPDVIVPDEPTAEGLSTPGIQEILRQAAPFADALGAAERELDPPPEPDLSTVHRPLSTEPPVAATKLESTIVDAGLDAALAREIVAEVVSHELPFSSKRSLKRLVRGALARRIPIAPTASAGARSIAFVGPGGSGKTLSAARLAAAYGAGSDLPVVVIALRSADDGAELANMLAPLGIGVRSADSGAEARAHLAGALHHALVVVDTPAVAPRSTAEVAALASELRELGVGEIHMTLPSTYSGPAARELAENLSPLEPTHVALTHMDATTHVGGLLDYAIRSQRPISYLSKGTGVPGGLEPAVGEELAALILP
jgi:flagellar biosynthesis GTPase FlhF